MDTAIAEGTYPISFRKKDASALGEYLEKQRSVELVGMKRVGINNFLRFFLFHEEIKKKYMPQDGKHFFIFVDLNDLIERELFPFWRLTFKRLADAVEAGSFPEEVKKKVANLFVASIQSGDLFLTYDGMRDALVLLGQNDIYPIIFFSRFDRLIESVTPEFFNNLQSLKDATHHKLTYVFTSYRELDSLMPEVFHRKDFSLFSNIIYLHPAQEEDSMVILSTMEKRHGISLSEATRKQLVQLAGGYVQYLQIFLLTLSENKKTQPAHEELFPFFLKDERIIMQSEELWESLTEEEKKIAIKVALKKGIASDEKEKGKYLWDTGLLLGETKQIDFFSPLFAAYVEEKEKNHLDINGTDFSKKENMLFQVLQEHVGEIAEREDIVEKVWPEYKEYGVSDWSIDRLVARVRNKLKKQKALYEIQTIRTRGYKLIAK